MTPTESGLNSGQAEFYATAAHVIPILLLAYVVEMAALAQGVSRWFEQRAMNAREAAVRQLRSHIQDSTTGRRLVSFYAYLLDESRGAMRYGLVLPLLLAIAALPVAAEVCAFDALAQNRSSQAFLVIVWLGLAVAGAMVLIPAAHAVVLLYKPVAVGLADTLRSVSPRSTRHQKEP
jgi:hypothetical protein